MPGTLYVVATPIGNLEDITLRALRVLREVQVIAAEDTRRTANLLAHHGISTKMLSFHAHNTRARIPALVARLQAGESVAVVTDAGTPGVSDPGVELVAAAHDQRIPVVVIPGASAALTAAVASGFPLEPLTFRGFIPTKAKDRKRFIDAVNSDTGASVFFESPHRIQASLTALGHALGNRPIIVARELTKIHEEILRGVALEIADQLTEARGEFTVVVGPEAEPEHVLERPTDEVIAHEFGLLTESTGVGRRAAAAELAKRFGMRANDVYSIVEKRKSYG